jgi:hypothetical protein
MRMSRKVWVAVLALVVVMIPIGAIWMAYAITQTDTTTNGAVGAESVWPIVAFFVAFIGGTLVTVGMLGFMFSWFSGGADRDDGQSPETSLAHAVPTTRVGWGVEATGRPQDTLPGGG